MNPMKSLFAFACSLLLATTTVVHAKEGNLRQLVDVQMERELALSPIYLLKLKWNIVLSNTIPEAMLKPAVLQSLQDLNTWAVNTRWLPLNDSLQWNPRRVIFKKFQATGNEFELRVNVRVRFRGANVPTEEELLQALLNLPDTQAEWEQLLPTLSLPDWLVTGYNQVYQAIMNAGCSQCAAVWSQVVEFPISCDLDDACPA